DEDRDGDLPLPGEELVVRLDLVQDGRLRRDPLGPQHLLDLEEDGVAVLEDGGDVLTDLDAARLLRLDHARAEARADGLVLPDGQDLVALDGLHLAPSFPSLPSPGASTSP